MIKITENGKNYILKNGTVCTLVILAGELCYKCGYPNLCAYVDLYFVVFCSIKWCTILQF